MGVRQGGQRVCMAALRSGAYVGPIVRRRGVRPKGKKRRGRGERETVAAPSALPNGKAGASAAPETGRKASTAAILAAVRAWASGTPLSDRLQAWKGPWPAPGP